MKRFVASLLIILGLAGCQTTPKPSWDVLAPFGSSRVPPPGTTSYTAKGAYYNPNAPATTAPAGAAPTTGLPATPNTATPGISPQRPQAALPQDRNLASDGTWRTPNSTASASVGQPLPRSPTSGQSTVVPAAFNVDLTAATVTQTPVGNGRAARHRPDREQARTETQRHVHHGRHPTSIGCGTGQVPARPWRHRDFATATVRDHDRSQRGVEGSQLVGTGQRSS